MRFTKDFKCKHQTAEGDAKTAETALPKKQSKSAGDRRRVHGLTLEDLMCSNTIPEDHSAEAQIFTTIVSVIAEKCAKCTGN